MIGRPSLGSGLGSSALLICLAVMVLAATALASDARADTRGGEPHKAVGPQIFGSVALPVRRTRFDGNWSNAMQPSPRELLDQRVRNAKGRSALEQLAIVNKAVNRAVDYATDKENWGVGDYWAPTRETLLRRKGDCEDLAIVKFRWLISLGFDPHDLFMIVGSDLVRRSFHAVLAVRVNHAYWILDNTADAIIAEQDYRDFVPALSFSSHGVWIHAWRQGPSRLVSNDPPMPGTSWSERTRPGGVQP